LAKKTDTKKKSAHNQYDALMRDNIAQIIVKAAEGLLELTLNNPEPFVTDVVSYTKREPDYVSKYTDEKGRPALLHLELQTEDDKMMVHRMRQYQCMYEQRFELPMYQYCIYMGQKPSKMDSELRQRIPNATNNYTYRLIELRNYPYRFFLTSNVPEMVLLAILGDYGGTAPEEIIAAILHKLQHLAESNALLEKYVNQLNTLSKLRNLQIETLKHIKAMPIHFNIEDDVIYQEIKEEERAKGREEKEKMIASVLKNSAMTTQEIARLLDIAVEHVKAVKEKHQL